MAKDKNENEELFSVDFSKMDAAIKTLLDIIVEKKCNKLQKKSNNRNTKTMPYLRKKINVEMIRKVLMEAKKKAEKKN